MTDYEYDPNTPYVFVGSGKVHARFSTRNDAAKWRDIVGVGSVADTTPKPKIPEDAEFVLITWRSEEAFTRRLGNNLWYWHPTEETISYQDLIELYLENGEVTVLVRKEES